MSNASSLLIKLLLIVVAAVFLLFSLFHGEWLGSLGILGVVVVLWSMLHLNQRRYQISFVCAALGLCVLGFVDFVMEWFAGNVNWKQLGFLLVLLGIAFHYRSQWRSWFRK